jgi:signal peptidase I
MPSDSPAARTKKTSTASAKQASAEGNVKDTVESILVAFILAFIFRAFVVEAFVIPTGSMAPTLMGAHMHFRCPDCGYPFDVNFSIGNNDDVQIPDYARTLSNEYITYNGSPGSYKPTIHCPNCGREVPSANPADPDNDAVAPPVYYGDRILVLKYLYLFQAPHRWDVVVFKAPVDRAKTNYSENYIKRLVGLPGETLVILDGDVYVLDPVSGQFKIQRKPYSVQRDLWRIVYDNDFIPQGPPAGLVPTEPRAAPWVQPWTAETGDSGWALTDAAGKPSRVFTFNNASGVGSLRFNADANPDTHALTDWLAYDQVGPNAPQSNLYPVSDLKLDCFYDRRGGDGALKLELTKRQDTFTAEVLRGRARLLDTDSRNGKTTTLFDVPVPDLNGQRPAQLEFANCDYRVWLRVNGKEVFATTDAMYHPDVQDLYSRWADVDALPRPRVRLLAQDQQCRVEHLSLWHDIYYINHMQRTMWATPEEPVNGIGGPIVLKSGPTKEYFVLGDNSPISGDARMWTEPVHLPAEMLDAEAGRVPAEFMLGKAFFVYWPAGFRPFSKTIGIRYPILPNPGIVPDFGDMRSIH